MFHVPAHKQIVESAMPAQVEIVEHAPAVPAAALNVTWTGTMVPWVKAAYRCDFAARVAGSNWYVKVDTTAGFGYFGHDHDAGGEGGLWFERASDGRWELSDYDGRYQLPTDVIAVLLDGGFIVDPKYI